jgi:transcriptional regulator with XRE-family HTH domain
MLDYLFQTRLHPDGRPYTYTEIARTMNGAVSYNHLKQLHSGRIKKPTRETIMALCRFFRIQPGYFFPELRDLDLDLISYPRS